MTLIESMMDDCIIMNKQKNPDGEGGIITEWTEGAHIKAAIVNDTSMAARVAEHDGVTATYTVTTTKENVLEFHDVIKRTRDGEIFRITGNASDKTSPAASTLNMAQVSAEKWELTS